jgi:hypothetical protein
MSRKAIDLLAGGGTSDLLFRGAGKAGNGSNEAYYDTQSAETRQYHQSQIDKIRQFRRENPGAIEGDAELLAMETELYENSLGNYPETNPQPKNSRLEQIREIARNDPAAYEANKALQQEQLALIQASLPAPQTVEPSPTTSQPAPAESAATGEI